MKRTGRPFRPGAPFGTDDFDAALIAQIKALNVWQRVPPAAMEVFRAHYKLMLEWNDYAGLTRIIEPKAAAREHYADSLAALPSLFDDLKIAGDVLDVGSGAGFPGLVLAVCDKTRRYFLAERNGKKAAFLNAAKRELSLFNVEVLNLDFSESKRPPGAFSAVVSRATFSDFSWLKTACASLAPGGLAVSYSTSPSAEIPPGAELLTSREYRLAGMNKSRFVHLIKKTDTTAEK